MGKQLAEGGLLLANLEFLLLGESMFEKSTWDSEQDYGSGTSLCPLHRPRFCTMPGGGSVQGKQAGACRSEAVLILLLMFPAASAQVDSWGASST